MQCEGCQACHNNLHCYTLIMFPLSTEGHLAVDISRQKLLIGINTTSMLIESLDSLDTLDTLVTYQDVV